MFHAQRTCAWRRARSAYASLLRLAASGLFGVATCAQAQSVSDIPSGSFIYSRDVPTREAQAKEPPGTRHYVALDQSGFVFGTLGLGLSPLADQDINSVSAAPGRALPTFDQAAPQAAALESLPNNVTASTSLLGSPQAASGGGTLGIPLQAIDQTMAALKTALGGPH